MWDIKWTDDFDFGFVTEDNGMMSIMLCEDESAYAQNITNRIRSVRPDWFYDNKGADLELLLGEPNTMDTALKGAGQIRSVLCGDGFVPADDLYIRPVPVNADTVIFFCFIQNPYHDGKLTFQTEVCLSGAANVTLIKDRW